VALIPRVVSHFILADSHTVTAQSLNINIWLKGRNIALPKRTETQEHFEELEK